MGAGTDAAGVLFRGAKIVTAAPLAGGTRGSLCPDDGIAHLHRGTAGAGGIRIRGLACGARAAVFRSAANRKRTGPWSRSGWRVRVATIRPSPLFASRQRARSLRSKLLPAQPDVPI